MNATDAPAVTILVRDADGCISRRTVTPIGMFHGPGDDGDEPLWRVRAVDAATGEAVEFAMIDLFGWEEDGLEVDGQGAYPPGVVLVPKGPRAPDADPARGAGDRVAPEGRLVRRAHSRAERLRAAARRRAGR